MLRTKPVSRLSALVGAICAALAAMALPSSNVMVARAQGVSPGALALSRALFPHTAVVQRTVASNQTADAATRLHTIPLEQLGRVDGYLETVWWTPRIKGRSTHHLLMLRYLASHFTTADQAVAACADADASLWEYGQLLPDLIAQAPTFTTTEPDGHGNEYVLLQTGTIEVELHLRYPRRTDRQTLNAGLYYLWRAAKQASALLHRLAPAPSSQSPPSPSQVPPTSLPPISLSPWGTGPVVKSPSLMTLNSAQLAPGSFRPANGPPLASHVVVHQVIVPSGPLARYAETSLPSGGALYTATSLYSSPTNATQAFAALASANSARRLPERQLQPNPAGADAVRAWRASGESIVAIQVQNVVMIVAGNGQPWTELASLVGQLIATIPTWFQAQGTSLVDARSNPVHLTCLNWYGFEQQDFVVGGLDFRSYEDILQSIKQLGYNCIRLPFSNQMVEQDPVVTLHVDANPELAGLPALNIMDHIVNYAGALGLSVILDDHRSDAGWSAEENGLWYTPQYSDAQFIDDWITLAKRYAVNNVVIAADLRNEPHGAATWGDGNPATDWPAAAERAGDAVLAANPHLLIMVEGIESFGKSSSYWWGGNLTGVATDPVVLHFADGSSARSQLVYSAHDYGPNACGQGCPWFNTTTTYQSLAQLWEQSWGYITADASKPYAAPVFVGEFGTCNYQQSCVTDATPGSQGQWFSSLVQYIKEKNLSWAYWSANGTESTAGQRVYGTQDWYGFFSPNWTSPIPWIAQALQGIQTVTSSGQTGAGSGNP